MFGMLPSALEAVGFEVVVSPSLEALDAPDAPDCLVVINLQEALTPDERDQVWRWVHEGGGLLCLGEHTDMAGTRGALNDLLASRLESGLDAADPPPEEEALAGIGALKAFLEWERELLSDPEPALDWLERGPPLLRLAGERPELASGGYLQTRDGSTLYLMVTPREKGDGLPALRRFVGGLRRAMSEVLADSPGFRVSFTGEPAMTVEEMGAMNIAFVYDDKIITAPVGDTILNGVTRDSVGHLCRDFGYNWVKYESGFDITALGQTGFACETDHDAGVRLHIDWLDGNNLMQPSTDEDEEDLILGRF